MAPLSFSQKSPGGKLRNRALTVVVASLIILLSVVAHAPIARADSTLVQQSNGGCATIGCSPSAISFPSSVTAGDVVVVAIAVYSGAVGSVGDTFGSTFTLVAEASDSPIDVFFYYATLSSSGSDAIFVTFTGATQGGVYIYEVSGVTTVGAVFEAAGGDCFTPPCSISSESASFQSGAFLVSMVAGTDYTRTSVVSTTPGAGFTLSPGSSGGTNGGNAEYATSGVSSPTYFPFTLSSPAYPWAEMGLALPPSGSTSSTTSTTTSTTASTSSTTSTTTSTTSTQVTSTTSSSTSTTAPPPRSSDVVTSLTLTATEGKVTGGIGGTLTSTLTPTIVGSSLDREDPSAIVSGNPAGISVSFNPPYDIGVPPSMTFTMTIEITSAVAPGFYAVTADDTLTQAGTDCSGSCVKPVFLIAVEPDSDVVESVSLTPSSGSLLTGA